MVSYNTFYLPVKKKYSPPKRALRFDAELDGRRGEFFAYRVKRTVKGKKVLVTEVYNKQGLRLMRTKKYKPQEIRAKFGDRKSFKFKKGSQEFSASKHSLPFRAYDAEVLSLKTKTLYLSSSRIFSNRAGKIEMSVTFYGSQGQKFTSEGGSARVYPLNIPSERDKAFDEAFRGAMADLPFSYTSFKINWIHYAYYIRHIGRPRRPKHMQKLLGR